ncbi:hypothetical protein [Streptomyces sp. Ru72]|nr:hypothetical protein [Streptomyces sp. Ru72]
MPRAADYAIEQRMVGAIPPQYLAAPLTDLECVAAALEERPADVARQG